ncbi:MAG: tRNA dihydrouridine synthase DusB [Anaerovoracaceae bacterium]|nr:tRNA dihydrouridine synthase DusB [Anaerovoracaceae bacterium]
MGEAGVQTEKTTERKGRGACSIAGIAFDNPYFLAPLAGVTDSPYRRICRSFGAGAVYSEMVSAKGMYYNDGETRRLLNTHEDEKPVVYQIFGSEPDMIAYAAEELSGRENCMLDINMGCPVQKIVKNGDGSALLKNPELAADVMRAAVKHSSKPVTAKIRIGWDRDNINAVEVAERLEDAGAAAIAVHGRTRDQFYSGAADRSVIKQVKEAVSIPVIGNGDIFNVADAESMFEETGCDAVMVARGALGNPWIFKSLTEGKDYIPPVPERVEIIKKHFGYLLAEKGEYIAVRCMRKHIGWYIKGIRGAVRIRRRINTLETAEEIYKDLDLLCAENMERNQENG